MARPYPRGRRIFFKNQGQPILYCRSSGISDGSANAMLTSIRAQAIIIFMDAMLFRYLVLLLLDMLCFFLSDCARTRTVFIYRRLDGQVLTPSSVHWAATLYGR